MGSLARRQTIYGGKKIIIKKSENVENGSGHIPMRGSVPKFAWTVVENEV
jgi:hypothetical protein